jgi:probable HAF family extracellular repeat protein
VKTKRASILHRVVSISGIAVTISASAHAAIQYNVVNLGTLGGSTSTAYAINNSGTVVGSSSTGSATHPFVYSSGSISDLLPTASSGTAYGINNNGQIVGSAVFNAGQKTHAFAYNGGTTTDIGQSLSSGNVNSLALGINNSGIIVGTSNAAIIDGKTGNPFIYNGSTFTFPTALGFASASATGFLASINNNGQAAGTSDNVFINPGNRYRAVSYSGSGTTLTDLGGVSNDIDSSAFAINSSGQIAGAKWETNSGPTEDAVIWNGGVPTLIPAINPSPISRHDIAYAIDTTGVAVGVDDTTGANHAFIYSGGTTTDLNSLINPSSGWLLSSAVGINDQGDIVGNGTFNGQSLAFELVPVPEPVMGIVGLIACSGALGSRRRRAPTM